MRARRSLPSPLPSLLRRIGGTVLGLALALALVVSPASSAPNRSGPGRATKTATGRKGTKSGAKSTARKPRSSGKSSGKSGSRSESGSSAASRPELPGPLPEMPTVDLGTFAALPGAESAPALPAGAPAATEPVDAPKPFAAFSRSATSMLDALMERARSQLGTRYVLGASSPGGALDCSAFTRFAMEALGLRLPRTAAQQARVGVAVPKDRTRLRPGDLLTFGSRRKVSHVGIYLGDGRFIHASVKSGQVIETTFAKNALLLRRWLGARRLFADADSMPATGG